MKREVEILEDPERGKGTKKKKKDLKSTRIDVHLKPQDWERSKTLGVPALTGDMSITSSPNQEANSN